MRRSCVLVPFLLLLSAVSGCKVIGPGIRENVLNCRGAPDSTESRVATCMAAAAYDIAQEKADERKRSGRSPAIDDECLRAPPVPMVRSGAAGIASHSFQPLLNREAVERVRLTDGLAVAVSHAGCSHYVLTYSFEVADTPPPGGPALLRSVDAFLSRLAAVDPESVPQELRGLVESASHRATYVPGDLLMGADTNRWAIVGASPADVTPGTVKVTYEIAF
jgi:hypothetical protein